MFELMTAPAIDRAQWKTRLHGPKPQPSNLYFTPDWPDAHKWAKDKYFEIKKTATVFYPRGWKLPGNDQKNLDLSNSTSGLKLYPATDTEGVAYEILIGLKPGNYQLGLYIPGISDYLLALGDSTMYPDLTDADKRNLATIAPEDSPYDNPLLKIWAISNMVAWILKVDVLAGIDFEKVILGFRIAKHRLQEIPKPDVFTTIEYYTAIKGTW